MATCFYHISHLQAFSFYNSVNLSLWKCWNCLNNYGVFEISISREIYTIEKNTSIVNIFIKLYIVSIFFLLWSCCPTRAMTSSCTRFLDHTQRRTTVGRTPPDEWSARQRPLPDNTQSSQQTDIHASGGIRTHHLSMWAAADLCRRPRCHLDHHRVYEQS